MENNEQNTNKNKEKKAKKECKKLLMVAIMSFLGSFLAFYVLMHQTILHYFSPIRNDILRNERRLIHDFNKDAQKFIGIPKKEFRHFKNKISAIQTEKYEDAYVIVVDLKQFNNNENNIRFNINGNMVTVSGNVIKDKHNKENAYFFTETFEIPEKINMEEIKKEKIGNKYIITLPIEY